MKTGAPARHALRLSAPQRDALRLHRTHRFMVLIAGRRWGKTRLAVAALGVAAASIVKGRAWYVAPTREMAKDIAWEPLREQLGPLIVAENASELTIVLTSGSTITLKSADEPDRLRGRALDCVVLDEFAQIAPETWDAVLRPALATTQGRALFIGTPDGRNWAYDLFRRAQEDTTGQWVARQYTTAQGGFVPADELSAARETMDSRLFRQEFEATFETAAGRVHHAFAWSAAPDGNVAPVVDDPALPLLVGLDFNVHPMSAVLATKVVDELHVHDAWQVPTSNTEEVAGELRRRYPDRRIIVYPDPSGKARKTSAPVGQTDFTILQRHGMQVVAPAAAPAVVDRINAVNALLCNASGRRRLLVAPKAKPLLRALDGLTYKPDTSMPDKTGGFDHLCDALGYLVWSGCNPLTRDAVAVTSFSMG